MLSVVEDTGQSQSAEGEDVIYKHLRKANDVRVNNHLQDTVSDCSSQTGAKTEPVTNQYDKHHRKQWYLTAEEMLQYHLVDEIIGKESD